MLALAALQIATAFPPVLIPKPKSVLLDYSQPVQITGAWTFPAGRPKFFEVFTQFLGNRFTGDWANQKAAPVSFDGGIIDRKMPEGHYRIRISPTQVSVFGQGAAGLRNGMIKLSQLAVVSNSKLILPTGEVTDTPVRDFRGVHLFVGPQALGFHKKLWTNVLRPMQFNYVLLECSRTRWKALGADAPKEYMSVADLRELVKFYRSIEVEPIPLVQSFGHMEWLTTIPRYKQLTVNPDIAYTLDPRKPATEEFLKELWTEVQDVFKPKTIHFGGDEIDMRGIEPKDPALTTELWKAMMPIYDRIRKQHKVQMMLWGDKALAPSEAIDAGFGDNEVEARKRREAIPRGAMITDWHYKAEPKHGPFLSSLQTWKVAGFTPIAASWFRPENIKGLYTAADVEQVGTLITSWAGYESNEANMRKEQKQFDAMILAGDFTWSARTEYLSELPYDPAKVFESLYNPTPVAVK
ncbi:MAG TPA: family 20 glycosylhydrolase [Fimbriimonas sp.]|nr:family 20 glycosylhydrolase [Fimbriimonas sp.]